MARMDKSQKDLNQIIVVETKFIFKQYKYINKFQKTSTTNRSIKIFQFDSNNIKIDKNIHKTPPNLLGIDRKIA